MKPTTTLTILVTLALALASCGSNTEAAGPTPSSDGGGGGAPDDAGAGATDATSPPSSVVTTGDTVTITMGPFTVPPSSEIFECQNFANPFGGVDQDINEYEVHMSPGSHHMFLFFDSGNADGPIGDCPAGGFEFHPYPFSAQTRDATLSYPDHVGSLVPATTGFRLNAHYINPGASPIQATVTTVLHKAAPGTIQQHAGIIFMNDLGLTVPPGPSTSHSTCPVPANIHVLGVASHMHQRATGFTAQTSDGTMLYQTDAWTDPAPRTFTPPLAIDQKTDVTWGCSYLNETSNTLTFGEYAATNVMCIFTMHYYPVADPKNPTIQCQKF